MTKEHGRYKGPVESEHDLVRVGRKMSRHPHKHTSDAKELHGMGPNGHHGGQQGRFGSEHLKMGFKTKEHA